jgi:hypothetical protein
MPFHSAQNNTAMFIEADDDMRGIRVAILGRFALVQRQQR